MHILTAKMAAQTGPFYRSTAEFSYQGICGTYTEETWRNRIIFQGVVWLAFLKFWDSVSVKDAAQLKGEGYVEEIARLLRGESN